MARTGGRGDLGRRVFGMLELRTPSRVLSGGRRPRQSISK
jgi:hypothetical protein